MGDVIEGKFGASVDEPDLSKKYICYFCEEIIEFVLVSWLHVSDGKIACGTVATPSNLQIVEEEE